MSDIARVDTCVHPVEPLLLLLTQQMKLGVLLGFCLLQEHVVVMNVLEAPLEADNFLDELEPIVQGATIVVV